MWWSEVKQEKADLPEQGVVSSPQAELVSEPEKYIPSLKERQSKNSRYAERIPGQVSGGDESNRA